MTLQSKVSADALAVWQAGVAGAVPGRLLAEKVVVDAGLLFFGDGEVDLACLRRIVVVGAGKAAAGMAVALENILGERLAQEKRLTGWINVPAGVREAPRRIAMHEARPQGVNEPTAAAAHGTQEILRVVGGLGPADLCICLISGGASALLPAPVDGLSLDDKIAITRELSARGATIAELNAVRRELSQVKGGGLARACRAGRIVSLILSDVPGNDLATIGSGPTVEAPPNPQAAIDVLTRFALNGSPAGRRAVARLADAARDGPVSAVRPRTQVANLLIGSNADAVDAAGGEAERRGYSHAMTSAAASEGAAEEVGRELVRIAVRMRSGAGAGPDCLITGGEPTVRLVDSSIRGRGGRNQQLALAALAALDDWRGVALVSGGTDGEDGPTDAAGALVDEHVVARARSLRLDPQDCLARNDAYRFFDATGGLIKTGPTGTNVCDLRVVCIDKKLAPGR